MSENQDPQMILTLLGPSASGKTALSIELAEKLNAEIIALDSTTPYKEFNIGTSKPDPLKRKKVPHHLIDIL
ncbi:MAG: isopentenyl transferase family protein, partial [Pseudomonadota bacterium]